jgi:hypothetical protein
MAVDVSDDLPILPPDAVPAQPSLAEQQRQHAEQNPPVDDGLPLAPAVAPSILNNSWSQAGKQLWDEGTRGALLGARATAQGLSSLPAAAADVVTWPVRAAQRAVGIPTTAPSDLVTKGLDAAGLPTPQTPTEKNVSTVVGGTASALPGLVMGGAPTVANALRLLLQGGAGALAGEKASQSDLVPWYLKPTASALAGMIGGKAADVGTTIGAKAYNAFAGNMSPEYNAFVRAGVDPRLLGTVAGGEGGQSAEAALSRIPFAASVLRPVQQKTLDQFGNSVDRTAAQLDPTGASVNAQTTGEALQNSYRNWQGGQFQADQAAKWVPLNQRMAGTAVDQSPYRAALDNAANPPNLASMPATQQAFSSPQAKAWLDALNADFPQGGNFSWEQAQAIKQRIGDAMGTPDLVGSIGMQNLKNIYGGLAKGMENTAVAHGQGNLFNEANAVTTDGHNFIDTVGSKIATANNPRQETIDPEQATKSVLNSGDTTMQAVRNRLPDAADVLAAYKLRQASTAKPSVASAYDDTSTGTFLTNMNRMQQDRPGGYNALYNDPAVQGQMDDLMTVAKQLRATERHVNTSGTAEQLGWMQYLKGIADAFPRPGQMAIATAVPPMMGIGGGRLLTSPLATRVAAAQGPGAPIIPPSRGGLLGVAPQLAAGQ